MIETMAILGSIAAFCAVYGGYVLIKGAIQLYKHIHSWFRLKLQLGKMNPEVLAMTIKDRLANGNYAMAQLLYDDKANKILDARRLKGDSFDQDLSQLHYRNDMVVYP